MHYTFAEPWNLDEQIARRRKFGGNRETNWRWRLDRSCDWPDSVERQRDLFRLRADGTAECSPVEPDAWQAYKRDAERRFSDLHPDVQRVQIEDERWPLPREEHERQAFVQHVWSIYDQFAPLPLGIECHVFDHYELAQLMLRSCETGKRLDAWDERRLIHNPYDYMSAEERRNTLIM